MKRDACLKRKRREEVTMTNEGRERRLKRRRNEKEKIPQARQTYRRAPQRDRVSDASVVRLFSGDILLSSVLLVCYT